MSVNKYNPETGNLERIAGGTVYADAPIGAIVSYGGTEAPRGWLLCDGQAVSRTTYSELFAKIGTNFGEGDGSTTFNVPDLRESVPVGAGESTNEDIEAHDVYTLGEFKDDQFQNITGKFKVSGIRGGLDQLEGAFAPDTTADRGSVNGGSTSYGYKCMLDASLVARTGTTTHGKQLGVNYIIKSENILVPGDFAEYIRLATTPDWSNAVEVTVAQMYAGYVCPGSGVITATDIMPALQGVAKAILSVNGVVVATGQYTTANAFTYGDATVPVAKDDVVKLNTDNMWQGTLFSFVPYKVQ